MTPLVRWGRAYFAAQALAGAAWWVAVFASPVVREVTLGGLDAVVVAVFDLPLFVGASALAAFAAPGGAGARPRGFARVATVAAFVSTVWTALVAALLAVYATVTTEAGWGVLLMLLATGGSVAALSAVVLGRIPTDWVIHGPFAFRTADAHRSVAANVLRTFAQIVEYSGQFILVIPLVIAFFEHRWEVDAAFPGFVAPLGVVLLLLASALGIWSAIVMSTRGRGTPLPSAMPNALVIAGPYRRVRNPMALAGIAQGVAVGLILGSWLVVVYALAGSLVWNYVVRPHEEADLESRFGAAFVRYRSAVRCWLPRLGAVTVRASPASPASPPRSEG